MCFWDMQRTVQKAAAYVHSPYVRAGRCRVSFEHSQTYSLDPECVMYDVLAKTPFPPASSAA